MATKIRPELSKRNKYYVEKHRYYELKHFCLQYLTWKQKYLDLSVISSKQFDMEAHLKSNEVSDPTFRLAERRLYYYNRIKLVERVAMMTDPELGNYILKGITEEVPYNKLKTIFGIPCSKDTYYDRYRRFFWILNKERDRLGGNNIEREIG